MCVDVLRTAGRIVVSLHVDDRLRGIARFQAVGHLRGLVRQGYLGGIRGVRNRVGDTGYHGSWLRAPASFGDRGKHDRRRRRLLAYGPPPLLAVPRRYAHIAYPPCRSTEGGERRPGRRPRRASQPPPASTWLALGYRFKPLVFTDQASEAAPQCPSAGPPYPVHPPVPPPPPHQSADALVVGGTSEQHRAHPATTFDQEVANHIPDGVVATCRGLQAGEQTQLLAGQLEEQGVAGLTELTVSVQLSVRSQPQGPIQACSARDQDWSRRAVARLRCPTSGPRQGLCRASLQSRRSGHRSASRHTLRSRARP